MVQNLYTISLGDDSGDTENYCMICIGILRLIRIVISTRTIIPIEIIIGPGELTGGCFPSVSTTLLLPLSFFLFDVRASK